MSAALLGVSGSATRGTVGANYSCRQACLYWCGRVSRCLCVNLSRAQWRQGNWVAHHRRAVDLDALVRHNGDKLSSPANGTAAAYNYRDRLLNFTGRLIITERTVTPYCPGTKSSPRRWRCPRREFNLNASTCYLTSAAGLYWFWLRRRT